MAGIQQFRKDVRSYSKQRHDSKLKDICELIRDGIIPIELTENLSTKTELIERVARYQVISSLLPRETRRHNILFSKQDIKDEDLLKALNDLGTDIPRWMAEAAAWKFKCLSELFPNGDIINSLKVPDRPVFQKAASSVLALSGTR